MFRQRNKTNLRYNSSSAKKTGQHACSLTYSNTLVHTYTGAAFTPTRQTTPHKLHAFKTMASRTFAEEIEHDWQILLPYMLASTAAVTKANPDARISRSRAAATAVPNQSVCAQGEIHHTQCRGAPPVTTDKVAGSTMQPETPRSEKNATVPRRMSARVLARK